MGLLLIFRPLTEREPVIFILMHYCAGVFQYGVIPVVQYHPVWENTSAIMALFLFCGSAVCVMDIKSKTRNSKQGKGGRESSSQDE